MYRHRPIVQVGDNSAVLDPEHHSCFRRVSRRARRVSGSETTNHSLCNHARDDEMSDAKNCIERDPIRQTKRCRSSPETVASTSPGSVWPGKRDISAMRFEMGTTSAMPSAVRIVSNRAASGAVRNKKM